jgi:hypothetical protein
MRKLVRWLLPLPTFFLASRPALARVCTGRRRLVAGLCGIWGFEAFPPTHMPESVLADEGITLALESCGIWGLEGSLLTHMPEPVMAGDGRMLVLESSRILASLLAHT